MRSVSQIYSEAIATRNNYLQITELDSGRSNSRLSIFNLLTYVVAVCIHTYEALLDVFQIKLVEVLNGRINGTPDWYVMMARKFQYDDATETGDQIIFDEDTLKIRYATINKKHRIIEKAAWESDVNDNSITLKVCKANSSRNSEEGVPYTALSETELTAFKMYIQQIKFVGAQIYSESAPGDILTIVADKDNPIFYDDSYITANQALDNIQKNFIEFVNSQEYNGVLYYQSILDILRKTEHILNFGSTVKVYISSYNTINQKYDKPVELKGKTRLKSGYFQLLDADSVMTINADNLTLIPASQMDSYYTDPDDPDRFYQCSKCGSVIYPNRTV